MPSEPAVDTTDSGETLKETVQGSIVKLLDDYEKHVAPQSVRHKFDRYKTALVSKMAHQNFWPLWLKSDYDYPENGEILDPKQLQSDYWKRVYYSLFMTITSFLILKVGAVPLTPPPIGPARASLTLPAPRAQVWLNMESALAKGTEVTVEPEGAPPPSAIPAPGSFFAVIEDGSTTVGGQVLYQIRRSGALDTGLVDPTRVPRHRLRQRKWHTTAFVGVTNDKKHDGWLTQANLNWQFRWWLARVAPEHEQQVDARAADDAPSGTAAAAPAAANSCEAGTAEAQRAAMVAAAVAVKRSTVKVPSPEVESRRMADWQECFAENKFSTFVGHSDNATHFKSGKMIYYWSMLSSQFPQFENVWVYFGCPGHGKGPWDGFGAVVKQRNNRDTKNGTFTTTSCEMKTSIDVAGACSASLALLSLAQHLACPI